MFFLTKCESDVFLFSWRWSVISFRWKIRRRFVRVFCRIFLIINVENSVADPDMESGIRCLFDPWIRDPEWVFSGSRIPNPYFWELSDNFLGKKFYYSVKICPIFFLQHFKNKIIFSFVEIFGIWLQKKIWQQIVFTPLFCCCFWILDPGSGMGKNQGSATMVAKQSL